MVDFITFGVVLGAEGYHRGSFWGSFGTLGPPFGGLWVALGVHFGESGGHPWALSARSRLQEGGTQLGPHHFKRFWRPKGVQKAPKMELKLFKKSIQKSIEILVGVLSGFWSIVVQLWVCSWDPGPSKMSVWCRRGAIFQEFTFFMPDSVLD